MAEERNPIARPVLMIMELSTKPLTASSSCWSAEVLGHLQQDAWSALPIPVPIPMMESGSGLVSALGRTESRGRQGIPLVLKPPQNSVLGVRPDSWPDSQPDSQIGTERRTQDEELGMKARSRNGYCACS